MDVDARVAQKRKLSGVFDKLDSSISSASVIHVSPERPFKKPRLYSSLLFQSKTETPHLSALISRFNSKRRPAPTSRAPVNQDKEYRPSSLPSLLTRLETYKLTTYTPKPPALNAVEAAKYGWVNQGGKDRLMCKICGSSWVMAGMGGEAEDKLVSRLKGDFLNKHKDGCPWKSRQCDDSVYKITLQTPSTTVNMLLQSAQNLTPVLRNVSIQHPLSANQVKTLGSKVISAYSPPSDTHMEGESLSTFQFVPSVNNYDGEPTAEAIMAAIFGWTPYVPPPQPAKRTRLTTPSAALSRSSSIVSSRANTPVPTFGESISRPGTPSPRRASSMSVPPVKKKQDNDMIYCTLCQRRVGLWDRRKAEEPLPNEQPNLMIPNNEASSSSSPHPPPSPQSRPLNLLTEHRPFCPYVTKETSLPNFVPSPGLGPISSSNTSSIFNFQPSQNSRPDDSRRKVEGWRAILIMASKASSPNSIMGMTVDEESECMNRNESGESSQETEGGDDDTDKGNVVKRMVDVVKRRGAREVMQYLKGVLH